ncbi:3-deoxy-7-phosphoheptulonate synthase [soil metagenome]
MKDKIKPTVLPLPTPDELLAEAAISAEIIEAVNKQRKAISRILSGEDKRRLAIIGPCSLDETNAALQFWQELEPISNEVADKVMTIVRAPVAKPRTIGGWRGLEQDSVLLARRQLMDLATAGAPIAIELLEPYHTAFYGDILCLGWIGARTVATQNLRLEASRNGMLPMLFKNGIDGSVKIAAEARAAAAASHMNVPYMNDDGRLYIDPLTPGNSATITALRGGEQNGQVVSNITPEAVSQAAELSREFALNNPGVIIDVSHANGAAETEGEKTVEGQKKAFQKYLQLARSDKDKLVRGIMIEALLREGTGTDYGMSRTDPTVDIETAKTMLMELYRI